MPLYWVIDSRSQLVTVTAEGELTLGELEDCMDAIAGGHAVPYAKIFDATECNISIDKEGMLQLAVSMRFLHSESAGPLAIVLPPEGQEQLTPILGILAAANRPLRFFTNRTMADKWIKTIWTRRLDKPPGR